MLEKCPDCDYVLVGLPVDHSCPECGLRYDSRTRVYVQRRPPALIGMMPIGTAPIIAVQVAQTIQTFPAGRPFLATVAIALAGVFFWIGQRYLFLSRRGRIVVTLPDFLYLRLKSPRGEKILWNEISRFTCWEQSLDVWVMFRDRRPMKLIAGVFRSHWEAVDFIRHAMRRIAGNAPSVSSPAEQFEVEGPYDRPVCLDESAVVIELAPRRELVGSPYAAPCAFCAGAVIAWLPLGKFFVLSLLAVFPLCILINAVLARHGRKLPQQMVISAQGVAILSGDAPMLNLPWAEISGARISRLFGMFQIIGHRGQAVFQYRYGELGPYRIMVQCVQSIERMRAIYFKDHDPVDRASLGIGNRK